MRLYELFSEQTTSLYVYRTLQPSAEFLQWVKTYFKTSLASDDFHVTIVYSAQPFHNKLLQSTQPLTVQSGRRSLERFGNAIVLRFESRALQARWQAFANEGAVWKFPTYNPHITITYGDIDPASIPPYKAPLTFGAEIFESVKTKFEPALINTDTL